jgi:hypothetical protein
MTKQKTNKNASNKTGKSTFNNGHNEPTFWMKGDGMIRRENNINEIKRLIESGYSYQDIIRVSRKYFSARRINEYYDIAQDEINVESESESATDYMKRKEAEKGENKNA